MLICLVNYDKALKLLHQKLYMRQYFLTTLLIGRITDRKFILTNQQVVLMLLEQYCLETVSLELEVVLQNVTIQEHDF